MKTFSLLIVVALCACASVENDALLPFKTTAAEIGVEKKKFRASDDDILFLLMINKRGTVIQVKRIASKLKDRRLVLKVEKTMYDVVYGPLWGPEDYNREVFFSYKLKQKETTVFEAYKQ